MLGMIGSNNTAKATLAKNASIQFIGSNIYLTAFDRAAQGVVII